MVPGSLKASQFRQTLPRMPVRRDISISAPQAGHSDMAGSSGEPQWKHWSNGNPPTWFYRGATSVLNAPTSAGWPRTMSTDPPATMLSSGGL